MEFFAICDTGCCNRHTDVLANKRTLAVRFGATFCRMEYLLNLVVAYGLVIWEALSVSGNPSIASVSRSLEGVESNRPRYNFSFVYLLQFRFEHPARVQNDTIDVVERSCDSSIDLLLFHRSVCDLAY